MARVRHSRQEFHARAAGLVGLAVAAALATGCKSGSWGAKPSWWSSSGTPPASALTSAPSFDKDIAKPSETAKPYPTTSTPEGYALSDATKTDAGRPSASPTGLVEPTAVTYGATPPPAAVPPAATAAPPAAVAGSSVGPQVGPYASLQSQSPPATTSPPPVAAVDPASAATAGMAAAPAFGVATAPTAQAPATQPLAAQPPAARYADASGSQAWPASPPPTVPTPAAPPVATPVAPAAGIDSRYGEANASRFGVPAAAVAAPPAAAPPVAPLEPAPAGLAPPAASPIAPPAAAGGDVLPGGITPPKRRPDPGYRPGGTSSYQPGKTILAGDEPTPPGVLPASFEAPPAGE